MEKKTAICEYLKEHHTGSENAIHSKELERLFFVDRRGLQRIVGCLREEGFLICSGKSGYFYAKNRDEIDAMTCKLDRYITTMSNAIEGMRIASAQMEESE